MHMTVLEAIGVGLGFLAIVAPDFWPKMPKPVSYTLAAIGLGWLTYSLVLGIEDVSGMKLQAGPLMLIVLGAIAIFGGLLWHIGRIGSPAHEGPALHDNPGVSAASEPKLPAQEFDYAYGLSFENLIPSLDLDNEQNTLEVRLRLKNTTDYPMKYLVEHYEYGIAKLMSVETHNKGGFISRRGELTFYPAGGFSAEIWKKLKDREEGWMEFTVVYGHPDRPSARRLYKKLHLDVFKKVVTDTDQSVNINWIITEEKETAYEAKP